MIRRYGETFFMERPQISIELLFGDGFRGVCLSTYQIRGTGDLTHTKYEYGSANKVGNQDYGPSGGPSYINIQGHLR